MLNAAPFLDKWPDLQLECLPNRDSLIYENTYGLSEANTIFRGTLRYRGFSKLMNSFQNMGMFDMIEPSSGTWDELLDTLRLRRGGFKNIDDFLLACADDDEDSAARTKECLEWLGMTGKASIPEANTVLDLFCIILEKRLQYQKNERDMVVMHHTILAQFEDGKIEQHQSSLQAFGDKSMSAMCKTVGYTAAAATNLILNGSLRRQKGLLLPTSKEIYNPILEAVKREGIVFSENVSVERPTTLDKEAGRNEVKSFV